MEKYTLKVPYGIKFISEWDEYRLPSGHCIVDKGVTGCGYTEYCLTNSRNIVLCSPRKLLLENKRDQHLKDLNILYLENGITDFSGVKDMETLISDHIYKCQMIYHKPVKFMVTYDSLRYISNFLSKNQWESSYHFIVDEFQSIFNDSHFKAEVEFDFVEYLQDCSNVIYLSATPMLDKYMERVSEFKDLPFYILDWSETGYVETVRLSRKNVNSLGTECSKIIQSYLNGDFAIIPVGDGKFVESKEAVFYFNSVTDIIRIVRANNLTPENTRIICSSDDKNKRKLKRIGFKIGKIPLKDEKNPVFMFCTSTTYVGVDFYSSNARSFVFSDPNIASLATDISTDLAQILGRQRNRENPFKNDVTVFYKTQKKPLTLEEFTKVRDLKMSNSQNLLDLYDTATDSQKSVLANKIQDGIIQSKYSQDFISFSRKTGLPVYNHFIDLADERAWEVCQVDYQDKISVTRAFEDKGYEVSEYADKDDSIVQDFLDNHFYATSLFHEKMRMYCEFRDTYLGNREILISLDHKIPDQRFKMYYEYYGTSGCSARKYQEGILYQGWKNDSKEDQLSMKILSKFKPGDRYTLSEIKSILTEFNKDLGISRKAKATDLENYFTLTRTQITLSDKTIQHGFKIGPKI